MTSKIKLFLQKTVDEQREWIQSNGGNMDGYINKYHVVFGRSVDEAIAIYHADINELAKYEDRLR